ncbi:MAG: hypothetical protein OEM77_03550 [Nitrosopumilus sp.]|nr:hypothetical protein [Nitrosopumilus sp.]MDH3833788.1 hypothetical protein [Nitrosopumilus sp.]
MSQRITIMLDSEISTKLRSIQSRMIKSQNKSVSFSRVINEILNEGLKHYKTKD